MLPVPSPDERGGFCDWADNPSIEKKQNIKNFTNSLGTRNGFNGNDPCKRKRTKANKNGNDYLNVATWNVRSISTKEEELEK